MAAVVEVAVKGEGEEEGEAEEAVEAAVEVGVLEASFLRVE